MFLSSLSLNYSSPEQIWFKPPNINIVSSLQLRDLSFVPNSSYVTIDCPYDELDDGEIGSLSKSFSFLIKSLI